MVRRGRQRAIIHLRRSFLVKPASFIDDKVGATHALFFPGHAISQATCFGRNHSLHRLGTVVAIRRFT